MLRKFGLCDPLLWKTDVVRHCVFLVLVPTCNRMYYITVWYENINIVPTKPIDLVEHIQDRHCKAI